MAEGFWIGIWVILAPVELSRHPANKNMHKIKDGKMG
jgi:hypothetical protein